MAKYRPKSDIVIAKPCSESWEAMEGDSRVRHCRECDRDVHNLASLTPSQIEAMVADSASLPCMRIARYADGTLLVAGEQRRAPYGTMAGAAMAGLVALAAGVANAQKFTRGFAASAATYAGRVVDPFGKPVPNAEVYLTRTVGGHNEQSKAQTNANGDFAFEVTPGEWQISATSRDGESGAYAIPLHLGPGAQKAEHPITLQLITITAGMPMVAPREKPAQKKR